MDYRTVRNQKELPEGLSIESLAVFLNQNMRPYEDTVADTARGLRYALSDEAGAGGFLVLAMDGDEVEGAVAVLETGMSGYVPEHLLLFIAVVPALRSRGIGGALMERAKACCAGDIKLHVEPDNPARRLYERQGFVHKYLEMK